jgi:tetratricopeptide (TPR) repeat protein
MRTRQGRAWVSAGESRISNNVLPPRARFRFAPCARIPAIGLAALLCCAALAGAARAQDAAGPGADPAAAETSRPSLSHTAPAPGEISSAAAETPPPAEAAPPPAVVREATPPANLSDLPAWLDYQSRRHIAALPLEARIFHRRGILLRESGNSAEAVRMVRGAAELDPGYIAPHLTLAEWSLLSEPSQALLRYATVLDLARQNFMLQLSLVANTLYSVVQALFLGLLATALLILIVRQEQLRHSWSEELARIVSRRSALYWSWALLILPFIIGLGMTLPALLLLGLLWPQLRGRERFVFVTLTAAVVSLPLLAGTLDRLTLPLDEGRAPLYGVALAETEPLSAERNAALTALARQRADNPNLQFAAAWAARRTGQLADAEHFYRKALVLWRDDDRTLNNLGCTLMMLGRADEALEHFIAATRAEPANAAAWFNQAQVFTQRYDYRAATDALSRASALNFELVKSTQSQGTDDGALPLVEQWIAPRRLWTAMAAGRAEGAGTGALPPAWRQSLETRGWGFSLAALVAALLGLVAGIRMHRAVPLRACSNCDRVVCRRCAERRRELALCPSCVESEKRAESPDFARLLLLQVRRRRERTHHLVRTALATLVPGLGLLLMRRVFSPLLILISVMGLLGPMLGEVQPFAFEPRLALAPPGLPWQLQAAAWIVLYTWSLLGYFRVLGRRNSEAAKAAAPVRSRVTQSTARSPLSDAA